jgi:hypothetical protein
MKSIVNLFMPSIPLRHELTELTYNILNPDHISVYRIHNDQRKHSHTNYGEMIPFPTWMYNVKWEYGYYPSVNWKEYIEKTELYYRFLRRKLKLSLKKALN